jgi:hypothetical protein
MTRDEIEELSFFDLGTEMDNFEKVYLLQKKKEKN